MTWPGHKGRVELSEERPNPIRQDRSNRDEISEWRPALPRQPHESRDMDLYGSQIQRTHGISDPTDTWDLRSNGHIGSQIQRTTIHSLVGTRTTESVYIATLLPSPR